MEKFDRKSGIGASEIATILGLNKYKTPVDLYLQKTDDNYPEEERSHHALRGKALEHFVALLYQQKTGNKIDILSSNEPVRHDSDKIFFASPDAMVDKSHLVELKTAVDWNKKKWEEKIPDEYYAQVQHQMYVTGAAKVDVACFFGDENFLNLLALRAMELSASDMINWLELQNELYGFFFDFMSNTIVHTILRDEDFIRIIKREGDLFFNHFVNKRIAPCPEGYFSQNRIKTHVGTQKGENELSNFNKKTQDTILNLMLVIEGEKNQISASKKLLESTEQSLLEEMERAGVKTILDNGVPLVSVIERILPSTIDRKKLQKEYPDAYNDVFVPSKGVTFSLKVFSAKGGGDE